MIIACVWLMAETFSLTGNAVYQDPVLKIQRIPDPPIVPLWTKAMTNLFQNNPDLNPDVLNLPPIPPAPVSGGGANWASTSNITAPSYTKTPVWDVTDPYVEACSCPPGKWAVTYDDGPLQYEAEFLATLASMNVKASFFVLGSNVLNYQQSLKDAYAAGHQIGIHVSSQGLRGVVE
ncbi:chitin deacetylase [Irineochytrium annulatum]|nr:chitin deacetylase [Irineochytrium annulatum]